MRRAAIVVDRPRWMSRDPLKAGLFKLVGETTLHGCYCHCAGRCEVRTTVQSVNKKCDLLHDSTYIRFKTNCDSIQKPAGTSIHKKFQFFVKTKCKD